MINEEKESMDRAAQELANAVAKVAGGDRKSQFETLEQYAERTKSHVFSDIEEFKCRLKRGFSLLVEQIEMKP